MKENPLVKFLCDIRGETLNAVIRKISEDVSKDKRNDLAAFIGRVSGFYKDGKTPRKIGCIDLVKALELESGYDEEWVYGKPTVEAAELRELELIHKLDDLIGGSFSAIHRLVASLERPEMIIESIINMWHRNPAMEKVSITLKEDGLNIEICYVSSAMEAAKKAYEQKAKSGFMPAILAEAIALVLGYEGVEALGKCLNYNCVTFRYEFLK